MHLRVAKYWKAQGEFSSNFAKLTKKASIQTETQEEKRELRTAEMSGMVSLLLHALILHGT